MVAFGVSEFIIILEGLTVAYTAYSLWNKL